jgi:hypothetical protein
MVVAEPKRTCTPLCAAFHMPHAENTCFKQETPNKLIAESSTSTADSATTH